MYLNQWYLFGLQLGLFPKHPRKGLVRCSVKSGSTKTIWYIICGCERFCMGPALLTKLHVVTSYTMHTLCVHNLIMFGDDPLSI